MNLHSCVISVLLILFSILLPLNNCSEEDEPLVYEMDDRITDFTTQGKWLILFYAPWCGHCKKLEPVFEEIGKYYKGKMMTIAKVDATRFVKAANHFQIKGYPTIKYVYGKTNINFNGERRKEDLIEFVKKCDTYPRVTRILHELDFENTKHEIPLFFVLILKPEQHNTSIKNEFYDLAEKHFLDAYFYYSHPDYVKKTAKVYETPVVGVIKDHHLIVHDKKKLTMEQFIKNEQFPTFCEVTLTNFHNLIDTRKYLLILLVNTHDQAKLAQTRKIKQIFKIFSKTSKELYHDEFVIGYTENHDLLSGIAIWSLPTPVLFILNTTSYTYSLFNFLDNDKKTVDFEVETILKDIKDNKFEFYGGQSIWRNIRRPLWEIYRAIIEMFIEAPIISMLIFGFPLGIISIVFYFLCCLDASDQPENDDDLTDSEEEDEHQQFLDEASRLHEQLKYNQTELEGEKNKIKLPISSKKYE